MPYLVALSAMIAVSLVLGRLAPVQVAPRFDHAGLRWRILHGERFGLRAFVEVSVSLLVLWVAWIEIFAILWGIGGRPLGTWMITVPTLANGLALVAVPLWLGASWTEVDADPVRLRLRGPFRVRELPWDTVTSVGVDAHRLVVCTRNRRFVLEAPQASEDAVLAAARWLEDGRRAPFPAPLPQSATPPEMIALVSRAAGRSAPPSVEG